LSSAPVVGAAAPPPAPPAMVAVASPPAAQSFNAAGWARFRLSAGLYRTGTRRALLDPTVVPHDQVIVQQQMYLRLRYAYGHSFELVASGLLDFSVFEQDAYLSDDFTLFNGTATRTSFEPSLREAYLGAFWRRFDFRLGQQRIAWGRGDAFTPNDVLNAYDRRDQLLAETEAFHLPTFALRGGVDLGFGSLELVVQPFFQPDRFDAYGGNWSIVQSGAPPIYRSLLNAATAHVDPTLHDVLQPVLGQTELPANDFSATSAGLRFAVNLHRIDFSLLYHYGYDRTPLLQIDPAFAMSLSQLDPSMPDLGPVLQPILAGMKPVRATYVRRHHAGFDLGTTWGPVLFRLEGAVDSDKVFASARDLQGFVLPALQLVGGIEYSPGELGRTLIVEGWYMHVFSTPGDQALLFARADTGGVATLVRWNFFHEHLELELRALVGLEPWSVAIRPQVGYKWRALQIRVGAMVLDGNDLSFGGWYRNNTSIYVMAKYSF
jgi:hypothetical protein